MNFLKKHWQAISAINLIFVFSFSLGVITVKFQVWPYSVLNEIYDFFQYSDIKTIISKFKNDFGISPERHGVDFDWSKTTILNKDQFKETSLKDFDAGRLNPIVYMEPNATDGYRLITGTFNFKADLHGAILLDPKGNIIHHWATSNGSIGGKTRNDLNVFIHGFEILKDGSIVYLFDEGSSLKRDDWCGKNIWSFNGNFHHSVMFDGKKSLWAWGDFETGEKRSVETGELLASFNLKSAYKKNDQIDILGIRVTDHKKDFTWRDDPFHANDIEVLTESMSKNFPQFNAGDVLVSIRNLNLIALLDPKTEKIKWWSQGLTSRQHDPDFLPNGKISVYNNRRYRDFTHITEIDPLTNKARILIDGKDFNFHSDIRGNHQWLKNGHVLITSPEQGRVFEVDKNNKIVFEFHNRFSENKNFVVSKAVFLPKDYFDFNIKDKKCN